jgi:hypothetical protein
MGARMDTTPTAMTIANATAPPIIVRLGWTLETTSRTDIPAARCPGSLVEILTANFRTVRGNTLIAALCDEMAFWRSDESANLDTEIISAIRPAMATIPGAMFLAASSPFAKRGAMRDAFRRSYGQDGPALIWRAPTRVMNP